MRHGRGKEVAQDIALILLSIIVAILLADNLGNLWIFKQNIYASILFAGTLFSSAFTTAPAIVLIASLGGSAHPFMVAAIGALGAVLADLLIFQFVEKRLAADAAYIMQSFHIAKLRTHFRAGWVRWLTGLAGALLIALPIPTDELGIALLGISRMRALTFAPLVYVFNFLGIYLVAYFGAH